VEDVAADGAELGGGDAALADETAGGDEGGGHDSRVLPVAGEGADAVDAGGCFFGMIFFSRTKSRVSFLSLSFFSSS